MSTRRDNTRARRRFINRPGVLPGLFGAGLLAALAALRTVAAADLNSVTLAGRTLRWDCWFRQHFGAPCPLCGLTRSVLVTLQGQIELALRLNWAGPLLVAGLLLVAVALVGVALCEQTPRARSAAARMRAQLRVGATAYAGLFVAVLLAHWFGELWLR